MFLNPVLKANWATAILKKILISGEELNNSASSQPANSPTPIEPQLPAATKIPFSQITLILSNLLPIFGIWLWSWDVSTIIMVYLAETFIAGLFAAAKIALAQKDYDPIPLVSGVPMISEEADEAINFMPKTTAVAKFLGAHILITAVASIFCLLFFMPNLVNLVPKLQLLIAPAIGFTISFAVSFKQNYLGQGEYLRTSARDIFRRHLTRFCLIFGSPLVAVLIIEGLGHLSTYYGSANLAESLNNNLIYGKATGIALIGLVTLVDYFRHIFEHRDLAELED
jgi:hypothetical protein